MVLGLFGMAVAVAPVFGPILGGYLAEAYSWRWAFDCWCRSASRH